MPEEELVDGADRISDPEGRGPSIWFHVVPAAKAVNNRLHLDIHASGERTDPIETHRKRVDAEASRLVGLGATITGALSEEGLDHYAGRDEGPGRQRVRYQLTAAAEARIT